MLTQMCVVELIGVIFIYVCCYHDKWRCFFGSWFCFSSHEKSHVSRRPFNQLFYGSDLYWALARRACDEQQKIVSLNLFYFQFNLNACRQMMWKKETWFVSFSFPFSLVMVFIACGFDYVSECVVFSLFWSLLLLLIMLLVDNT